MVPPPGLRAIQTYHLTGGMFNRPLPSPGYYPKPFIFPVAAHSPVALNSHCTAYSCHSLRCTPSGLVTHSGTTVTWV